MNIQKRIVALENEVKPKQVFPVRTKEEVKFLKQLGRRIAEWLREDEDRDLVGLKNGGISAILRDMREEVGTNEILKDYLGAGGTR